MFVRVCVYARLCACVRVCASVHVYVHMCVHVCVHVCAHVCSVRSCRVRTHRDREHDVCVCVCVLEDKQPLEIHAHNGTTALEPCRPWISRAPVSLLPTRDLPAVLLRLVPAGAVLRSWQGMSPALWRRRREMALRREEARAPGRQRRDVAYTAMGVGGNAKTGIRFYGKGQANIEVTRPCYNGPNPVYFQKQEAVLKATAVRSPLPVMSPIPPCPPCLPWGGWGWGGLGAGGFGGRGRGRGRGLGGRGQGAGDISATLPYILHYHMVLCPKRTSHNNTP